MVCWISARLPAARRALVIARASDNLEVARELPIGDVLAELALFPFPCRREMLDEGVVEERARDFRLLEPLRGLPEGTRQVEMGRKLELVRISRDGCVGLDLVLDAPEPAPQGRGERDIGVRVGCGDAVLDPLRARAARDG